MFMNQYWPRLELTDEEREWCRSYDGEYTVKDASGNPVQKTFPGVYRRTYVQQLRSTTFTNETNKFQDNYSPSGRRTRIFAFTFSGFVAGWQIKMFSTSGEQWVQDFTTVTALVNSAPRAGSGMSLEIAPTTPELTLMQQGVIMYRRDPNILLEGTQELVFQGQTLIAPFETNGRFVLNIATHVWEFPDMPRGANAKGAVGGATQSMGRAMAAGRGR